MTDWRLDPWSPADARAVARLHGACFDESWSAGDIRRLMDVSRGFGYVLRLGRLAQGFTLNRIVGDDCEILSIGVTPRRRSHGLASRLLEATIHRATTAGASRVILEVAFDNEAGRGLYLRHGFLVIGMREKYYRRDHGRVDSMILAYAIEKDGPGVV